MTQGVPGHEILGELGRGGMGVVYRARDLEADRVVALKLLLLSGEPSRVERFRREGIAAARLDHPGIVRVHRTGVLPSGGAWISFELVEGRPLNVAFRDLIPTERVEVLRDVAAAVGYAHSKGVVHRDLKPSNIIVDRSGRPRILDFGLARVDGEARLTVTGQMLGTPRYVAPEQFAGFREEVGPHSDVWSLGVILYEAITDQHPFPAASLVELAAVLDLATPPRPSRWVADLSPALERVTLKAIAKRPGNRYPDALALAAALEEALTGQGAGRRRWKALGLMATAIAAAVALAGVDREDPVVRSPDGGAAPVSIATSTDSDPRPTPRSHPTAVEDPPAESAATRRRADAFAREGRWEQAADLYKRAADGGDVVAKRRLGELFRDGRGVPVDAKLARRWLEEAFEGGDARAGTLLGYLFQCGTKSGAGGIARDLPRGVRWFELAARRGDPLAMRALSEASRRGLGLPASGPKAREWLRRAAERGDAVAADELGQERERAGGVPEAIRWYRRAASLGYPEGARRLMHHVPKTAAPTPQAALEWLREAASAGDPQAMLDLGSAHERARYGLARNMERATTWYRRAAQAGSARGMAKLADVYSRGRGEQDAVRAARWYRAAHALRLRRCTVDLALLFKTGRGVERDPARAVSLLREAAPSYPRAMRELAIVLLADDVSAVEGLDWLTQAVTARDARAIVEMARLHALGRITGKRDPIGAVKWLRVAADREDAIALFELASRTLSGQGTTHDFAAARALFAKAEAAYTLELEAADTSAMRVGRSEARWKQDKLSAALTDLHRAVELKPAAETWGRIAEVQMNLGLFDDASASIAKAFALDPRDGYTHYVQVETLLIMEKPDEALAAGNRMVEMWPRWRASYLARARVHLFRKDGKSGLADCKRGLRRSPGHAVLTALRGYAHALLGEARRGRRDCDAAVARNVGESECYRYRAKVRLLAGDLVGARADLKMVVKLEPATHPLGLAAARRLKTLATRR